VASDIEMTASGDMQGKLTGAQTGAKMIDIRTGMAVKSDMSQNIKGAVTVQGFDVQMELATTMKTTTKEVK
jgi:hypothetical protein